MAAAHTHKRSVAHAKFGGVRRTATGLQSKEVLYAMAGMVAQGRIGRDWAELGRLIANFQKRGESGVVYGSRVTVKASTQYYASPPSQIQQRVDRTEI